jgi:hypothetical protein
LWYAYGYIFAIAEETGIIRRLSSADSNERERATDVLDRNLAVEAVVEQCDDSKQSEKHDKLGLKEG